MTNFHSVGDAGATSIFSQEYGTNGGSHLVGLVRRGDPTAYATFDSSGAYRYELGRCWDSARPACTFVMLNPSTADETVLDPTVRRCLSFARVWGFGSLRVGNIFGLRSTDPRALYSNADPVGPDNLDALVAMAASSGLVVAAWGNHGLLRDQGARIRALLGPSVHHLGLTGQGQPRHPLYLRSGIVPERWA